MGDSALSFVGYEDKSLGKTDGTDGYAVPKRIPGPWTLLLYEGHPQWDEQLIKTKKIIEELDVAKYGGPFTVVLYNRTLIGWQEKEMDFYLDTNSKYVWGSSIQPSAPDVKGKMSVIKLPMRDLCKDIMDNYRPSDYVIVKMDIEGTEFHLVRSMLVRGVMPYIDELFVEFHRFAGADGNDDGHAFANIFINEYVPIAKEELHMKFGSWS